MQKVSTILLFLCIISNAYSQNYDLIVTDKGDSIACRINEVTDAAIYLRMKYNDKWVQTNIKRDEVIEYKYDAIYKYMVEFRPGTSYIEKFYNEQDANLMKAVKLQKSGKVVTIVGGSILGATVLATIIFGDKLELGVVIVDFVGGLAGLGTMAVGIPMNITGKNRAKQINANLNSAFGNGITIDLKPCAQYNLMTQHYQPAVVIRIRF